MFNETEADGNPWHPSKQPRDASWTFWLAWWEGEAKKAGSEIM